MKAYFLFTKHCLAPLADSVSDTSDTSDLLSPPNPTGKRISHLASVCPSLKDTTCCQQGCEQSFHSEFLPSIYLNSSALDQILAFKCQLASPIIQKAKDKYVFWVFFFAALNDLQ